MARYLIRSTPTALSWAAVVQNPQNRADAFRPVAEDLGGKLLAYYFGVAQSCTYAVVELPDEITVEALVMAVLASGVASALESTPILTAEEAMEAMRKAKEVSYRPPSG